MTAVTARVAGVETVIVASPRPAPATLGAAFISDADLLLAVGGAQAIAALAYGIDGISPCDIIVGPGNKYCGVSDRIWYWYSLLVQMGHGSQILGLREMRHWHVGRPLRVFGHRRFDWLAPGPYHCRWFVGSSRARHCSRAHSCIGFGGCRPCCKCRNPAADKNVADSPNGVGQCWQGTTRKSKAQHFYNQHTLFHDQILVKCKYRGLLFYVLRWRAVSKSRISSLRNMLKSFVRIATM